MADYVNVNGQIIRYEEGGISAADAGLLHGAGLFETMRVKNRKLFRGRQHLERLAASAQVLGVPVSLGLPQLTEMVEDLCEVNALQDARVRLTVTRGDLHAATAESPIPPVTLILSASPFEGYPAALYDKGMLVVVSRFKQNPENPLTGHKSTSYFDRLLAIRDAKEMSSSAAGEALWFTAGTNTLAEGSISNVFLVDKEGFLVTPPLTVPDKANQRLCLPGITRAVVIELATGMNILVHERLLTINDVLAAKELFLTNAVMGVMPVTAVEKHPVSDGKPGEITRRLREAYESLLTTETA